MAAPLLYHHSGWAQHNELLVGAIGPLDAGQLSLRAAPGLWSVRTLANHIVSARAWWFHGWMGEGDEAFAAMADYDEDEGCDEREAVEIVAALRHSWSCVAASLDRWTEADLDATFQRPAPNVHGERPWRNRQFIVWHVAEHDLHHGGEISLTLGMHGVPALNL